MPTSDYHHISDVLHVLEQIHPASVLDIGIGFGKWGILCREILEIYRERLQPRDWITKIDGIEIFKGYRNPLWNLAYNKVYTGDALQLLDRLGCYNLILAGDVIEHFNKEKGKLFMGKMLDHGDVVIVTSPRGDAPQGGLFGNKHEQHLSCWSQKDFSSVPHLYKDVGFTFIAVLSKNPERLKKINVRHPLDILGVKKGSVELMQLILRRAKYRLTERKKK